MRWLGISRCGQFSFTGADYYGPVSIHHNMLSVGFMIVLILVLILITRIVVYTGVIILFVYGVLWLLQKYPLGN